MWKLFQAIRYPSFKHDHFNVDDEKIPEEVVINYNKMHKIKIKRKQK